MHETFLDTILRFLKRVIPKPVFLFFAPAYHTLLAYLGAVLYGFPSRSMKVIGVTGTKGKSTTVFMLSRILAEAGKDVAAIGSLGFKLKDKEWPNILKMTMPGRFKLQRFLSQAKKAGCTHVVLEVTSEGIAQKRHLGISFDAAVFTNLHREHLESHGSFEAYMHAKQELFRATPGVHIINGDDAHAEAFARFPATKKVFYGISRGDIRASHIQTTSTEAHFEVYGTSFTLHLGGEFNVYNALAAIATAAMYGVDLPAMRPALERIMHIPGRMEYIQERPFAAIVDYAHTPDSLRTVYETVKPTLPKRLVCVFGAAGGGRDKWKRPEFGKIADTYCNEIFLTDEDPYDEDPKAIVGEIQSGIEHDSQGKTHIVMDRKDAMRQAFSSAREGDVVIVTGKGSETSIARANGKKIPWSDAGIMRELLKE